MNIKLDKETQELIKKHNLTEADIREAFSYMALAVLLISTLTFSLKIQPTKGWDGTVYVRANGNIDPPTACISRYESLYVLEDDITGDIMVERNNIVIDGENHTIRGSAVGLVSGIYLSCVSNVTILNFQIENASIDLRLSSNCSILSNTIRSNCHSVLVLDASNDNIVFNNTIVGSACKWSRGVDLMGSRNKIMQNTIMNYDFGVSLRSVYAIGYTGHAVDNIIVQNEITRCKFGVRCSDPNNCFTQNKIMECEYGYYLVAGNITITLNDLLNNTYGIMLMDLNNSLVNKNNLIDNDLGVWISYSFNVSVTGNYFQKNNVAIILSASGSCNVTGNIISNGSTGIFLSSVSELEIFSNTLTGNLWGILSSGCFNILIVGNDFISNELAIRLENDKSHEIFHNNFINNSTPMSISASEVMLDKGYPVGGNYWSDYIYSDLNGDGIGETDYRVYHGARIPGQIYADKYPFMNPRKSVRMKILVSIYPEVTTKGTNVTIEGSVDAPPLNVSILCRLNNGTWTMLETIQTGQEGHYSFIWNVTQEGLYEIKIVWLGNSTVFPVESAVKGFRVESRAEAPLDFQFYLKVGIILITIIIISSLILIFRYRRVTKQKSQTSRPQLASHNTYFK